MNFGGQPTFSTHLYRIEDFADVNKYNTYKDSDVVQSIFFVAAW